MLDFNVSDSSYNQGDRFPESHACWFGSAERWQTIVQINFSLKGKMIMASYVRLSIRYTSTRCMILNRSGKVISIDQENTNRYIRSPVGRTQSAGNLTRTQEVIQVR